MSHYFEEVVVFYCVQFGAGYQWQALVIYGVMVFKKTEKTTEKIISKEVGGYI